MIKVNIVCLPLIREDMFARNWNIPTQEEEQG
jgi:hypothetical protein